MGTTRQDYWWQTLYLEFKIRTSQLLKVQKFMYAYSFSTQELVTKHFSGDVSLKTKKKKKTVAINWSWKYKFCACIPHVWRNIHKILAIQKTSILLGHNFHSQLNQLCYLWLTDQPAKSWVKNILTDNYTNTSIWIWIAELVYTIQYETNLFLASSWHCLNYCNVTTVDNWTVTETGCCK